MIWATVSWLTLFLCKKTKSSLFLVYISNTYDDMRKAKEIVRINQDTLTRSNRHMRSLDTTEKGTKMLFNHNMI